MNNSNSNTGPCLSDTDIDLEAERRQFASDRRGIRQLGMALDRLTTRSLRKFAELITGDPLLRQVLISPTFKNSYVDVMEGAALAAASQARPQSEPRRLRGVPVGAQACPAL